MVKAIWMCTQKTTDILTARRWQGHGGALVFMFFLDFFLVPFTFELELDF
jgi:hypothetical protein